jgi:hypothetical protein
VVGGSKPYPTSPLPIETVQAPDIRYRWEWQLGRLLEKQGDIKEQLPPTLEPSMHLSQFALICSPSAQMSNSPSGITFNLSIGGLVDLLWRPLMLGEYPSSGQSQTGYPKYRCASTCRTENFLGCNLSAIMPIDQVSDPKAAIIYPIILEDRIAIISELPGSQQR